jgi:ParB family chromosome partitioning protein
MDNSSSSGPITELEVQLIQFNPLQPRGVIMPESLTELVDSIREQGILEPLVVADTPAGYQLIAGERRLRAAKILGMKLVPVVVRTANPQGILEMSIVENVQREDLNPIERALAYRRLIDEFGLSASEVAKRVGKSLPVISNTVRLLTLPDAIKDALVAGVISEGHVRPLITLGDPALMLTLFKRILKENSTARQTEEMARHAKSEIQKKEPKTAATKVYIPEIIEYEKQIKQARSEVSKVKISQSGRLARIIIEVKGDSATTQPHLQKIVELLSK